MTDLEQLEVWLQKVNLPYHKYPEMKFNRTTMKMEDTGNIGLMLDYSKSNDRLPWAEEFEGDRSKSIGYSTCYHEFIFASSGELLTSAAWDE
jgi:hypothetical protein